MKKRVFLIIFVCFLTACNSTKEIQDESVEVKIDKLILDAAVKIQDQQTALFMAGALNQVTVKPKMGLTGENKYTVVWYGDAIELLTKMAHDQNMNFNYSGVRLPLPISMKSVNVTLNDALKTIESQINYRSDIVLEQNTIHLKFHTTFVK